MTKYRICSYHLGILQRDILKLESVQCRFARFVLIDYARLSSVASMLQKVGWPTLEQCRDSLKIFMLYKIIYIDYDESLIRKENSTWGYFQRYYVAPMRINAYIIITLFYHLLHIREWSILPNCVSKPVKSAKYIIHCISFLRHFIEMYVYCYYRYTLCFLYQYHHIHKLGIPRV